MGMPRTLLGNHEGNRFGGSVPRGLLKHEEEYMHLLFVFAIAAIIALGFSWGLDISIIFGFALFICCIPVLIGGSLAYHYLLVPLINKCHWRHWRPS